MNFITKILHAIAGVVLTHGAGDAEKAVALIVSAAEKEQAIHSLTPGQSLQLGSTNANLESVPGRLLVYFQRDTETAPPPPAPAPVPQVPPTTDPLPTT